MYNKGCILKILLLKYVSKKLPLIQMHEKNVYLSFHPINEILKIFRQQKCEVKKITASLTFNHFYEKVLLLKDRMNTVTGKKLAEQRHRFMEDFLRQFYAEWECEV